jgi:DNA-binding beta-propeller fold protein YncE
MRFSSCAVLALLFCLISLISALAQSDNSVSTGNSTPLASPKFLYSSDYADNLVYEYSIDAATGVISPTSQVYIAAGLGPGRMASDKGGYRLYVIDVGSSELSAYFINRDNGTLQPVPGSPFALTAKPTAVAVHPSGDFVYVTLDNSYVTAFAVQSDGSLATVSGSPFATKGYPTAVIVDPTGYYVFVSDDPSTSSGYVDAYVVNTTTGALAPVHGEPYLIPVKNQSKNSCFPAPPGPGSAATDLAIEPGRHRLLVPGWCDGQVVEYNINETTGALSSTSGSPDVVPDPCPNCTPGVVSIAVDPLNRWWYLYENVGVPLSMSYSALTTFKSTTLKTNGSVLQCGDLVRADPSGKFVYAIGNTTGNSICGASPGAILGFSVNQSTGLLTPLPGSPWASPNTDELLDATTGLVVTR